MSKNKQVIIIQLYNRTVTLLDSIRFRSRKEREREIAYQYNTLRSDIKKLVNDPKFDRIIKPVWCLRPFSHIPILFSIFAILLGFFYFLIGLEGVVYFIIVTFILVLIFLKSLPYRSYPRRWWNRDYWFLAGTIGQIIDRLKLLQDYLEHYITINYPSARKSWKGKYENTKAEAPVLSQYSPESEIELDQEIDEYLVLPHFV